jgi:polysaccharide biosynthesis transport protein
MERIILPYGATAPPTTIRATPVNASSIATFEPDAYRSAKSAGAYLNALRKRFWLAILTAGLIAIGGSVAVLRQEPIYRASAQIQIEPPQFDSVLTNLVSERGEARLDPGTSESYESNRLAQLRNRGLVEKVLVDPRLGALPGGAELVYELLENLQTTQLPRTTRYDINLEGRDPGWIAKVLNVWLEEFQSDAKKEVQLKVSNSAQEAQRSAHGLEEELKTLEGRIAQTLEKSPVLSPDGENMLVRRFDLLSAQKMAMIYRHDDMLRNVRLAQAFPDESEGGGKASRQQQEIAELEDQEDYWLAKLAEAKRITNKSRHLSDPHIKYIHNQLNHIHEQIAEVNSYASSMSLDTNEMAAADPFSYLMETWNEELAAHERKEDEVFKKIQEMAPKHNELLMLLSDRVRKRESLAELRDRINDFNLVASTQNEPVKIVSPAVEPTKPVRPNRPIQLALVMLFAVACGAGLVMLMEHLDHSVRAPELASLTLGLPLLGVVPRMRRTARLQRGGHLWTQAAPHSVEADAYRSLRASLVGMTGATGKPLVSLLITSSKPGEGKSTTALNLAATFARSGERTLLMDVDLRRPSLRQVFDDGGHNLGLADVLRGELPWQRALIQTEIPNLDFLPTGDPSGIPVEVLGALELRQLMIALSGHYDRIILDGPAILGLADCRMLGRVVEAAALVVRAGAHDLRPIQRAKAMMDQSGIRLAGVVFNGLLDDLANWSSYAAHEYESETSGASASMTASTSTAAIGSEA